MLANRYMLTIALLASLFIDTAAFGTQAAAGTSLKFKYSIQIETANGEEKNKGEVKTRSGEAATIDLQKMAVDVTPLVESDGNVSLSISVHEKGSSAVIYSATARTQDNGDAALVAKVKDQKLGAVRVEVGLTPVVSK